MKTALRITRTLIAIALLCAGCTPLTRPEEVTSRVTFRLQIPDGMVAKKMNVNITCTNVNTQEKVQSSSISTAEVQKELQRGLYIVQVDGVLLVHDDTTGGTIPVRVRGYKDKVLFVHASDELIIPLTVLQL